MTKSIPITKPYFDEREKELIQKPLESGWVVQGEYVEQFEKSFSEFISQSSLHSIASTSCTTALHLAVRALGLEPGDEVIVPAFTWVSTANVIEYEQARPVFVDINPGTFNIDVEKIEAAISNNTVGIIPVHLFGLCANMDPITQIADEHDLWVVEDAACGLGARINGQHAGTFGEAGCFSFHPRKSITTGEGGMVTTHSAELNKKLRSLRDHGASRSDHDRHEDEQGFLLSEYNELGYNYRMTDLQGALGCAQMEKANYILEERRKQASIYDELLADLDGLKTPHVPKKYDHGYQAYVITFTESPNHTIPQSLEPINDLHEKRNELMTYLAAEGIQTRQGTHAAFIQGYYRKKYNYQPMDYPRAYAAQQLTLALPIYVGLIPDEQQMIIEKLSTTGLPPQ